MQGFNVFWRVIDDGVERGGDGIAEEWVAAEEHFSEDDAESPEIAALIEGAAHYLLGGHVEGGAGDGVLRGGHLAEHAGEAEVNDFNGAGGGDHDVGGLDVAMDDAAGMGFGEAVGHLRNDADGFVDGKRTAADGLGEGGALVVGHDDEGLACGGFLDAVNDADVGMVERGCGAGFAEKALFVAVAGVELRGKEFEGDGALETEIESAIDHAHSTGPGDGEHAVVAGDGIALGEALFQLWHTALSQRPVKLADRSGTKANWRVAGNGAGRCAAMVRREALGGKRDGRYRGFELQDVVLRTMSVSVFLVSAFPALVFMVR